MNKAIIWSIVFLLIFTGCSNNSLEKETQSKSEEVNSDASETTSENDVNSAEAETIAVADQNSFENLSAGNYLLNISTGAIAPIASSVQIITDVSPNGNFITLDSKTGDSKYGSYYLETNTFFEPKLSMQSPLYALSYFDNQRALYTLAMGGNDITTDIDDNLAIIHATEGIQYTHIFNDTLKCLQLEITDIQYGSTIDLEYSTKSDTYYALLYYSIADEKTLCMVNLDNSFNILDIKRFESYFIFDGMRESEKLADQDSYGEHTRFEGYETHYISNEKILISSYTSDNWKTSKNSTFQMAIYDVNTNDLNILDPVPTTLEDHSLARLISTNNILINENGNSLELYNISENGIVRIYTLQTDYSDEPYNFTNGTDSINIESFSLIRSSAWTYDSRVLIYAVCKDYTVDSFIGENVTDKTYREAILYINKDGEIEFVMPLENGLNFKGISSRGELIVEKV